MLANLNKEAVKFLRLYFKMMFVFLVTLTRHNVLVATFVWEEGTKLVMTGQTWAPVTASMP